LHREREGVLSINMRTYPLAYCQLLFKKKKERKRFPCSIMGGFKIHAGFSMAGI
jgi:hypothetical protein